MPSAPNRRTESRAAEPEVEPCRLSTTRYRTGGDGGTGGEGVGVGVVVVADHQARHVDGRAAVLTSSTQSLTGLPALLSTSLITTGRAQSFAAPLVETVVVAKSPVPSGQRPYVTAACTVQL